MPLCFPHLSFPDLNHQFLEVSLPISLETDDLELCSVGSKKSEVKLSSVVSETE